MAFFADLTPHTYTWTGGLNLLNVGWLDEGNDFPVGVTSSEFQFGLFDLCGQPMWLHRGSHSCSLCDGHHPEWEGNGQIRVQGRNGVWYAAPTLVRHYVDVHQYLPPAEFVEAVLLTIRGRKRPVCPLADYGAKGSKPPLG